MFSALAPSFRPRFRHRLYLCVVLRQNWSPPKIGPAGPILAEKLVPPDHFCYQNWSPFAKISPPTKVTVLASYSYNLHHWMLHIVTYVSHDQGYIKLIIISTSANIHIAQYSLHGSRPIAYINALASGSLYSPVSILLPQRIDRQPNHYSMHGYRLS